MQTIEIETLIFSAQVVSDVHLEFRNSIPDIQVSGTVLFLCGDVGNPFSDLYNDFIDWCSENYAHTFVIAGNHEFYDNEYYSTLLKLEEIMSWVHNVTFLNDKTVLVKWGLMDRQIRIFGGILWSDTRETARSIETIMNDYKKIKLNNFTIKPEDTSTFHKHTLSLIKKEVLEEIPLIILTHHLPSFRCIDTEYKALWYNDINTGYASNCDKIIKPSIKLWCHGHSHSYLDILINDVRVIRNPMGYPGDKTTFTNFSIII